MSERMTGARAICESLLREGVEVIFGIPGGAVLPLYDALWHYPMLRHVLMRHEQAAAHAAAAYARATGRVGFCLSTSGPGATNLITGLVDARMDSTPLVAITGQVARPFLGTEAFQECDTTGIARPVLKRVYLVLNPRDLGAVIHEAFEEARHGRPGPVLIDIPKDVQAEEADFVYPDLSPAPAGDQDAPADARLATAARLLNEAARPIIIAGHGVHLSGATPELLSLAERANVPVMNTLHGTGAFPRQHPLALGMLGMHGMYWSNIATCEADVILAVGMRFDDRVTGRPGTFARHARVIHIEIDAAQVSKNVRADVPLIGDARPILQGLLPLVLPARRDEWFRRLAQLRDDHPSLTIPEGDTLTPQYLLHELDAVLQQEEDPLVVTGVGQHQMWAAQFLRVGRPRSFITSGGLGTMGFEIPAAIGAQIGRPQASVWSIAGDGGLQMTLQEFATITQEHLPIRFVVMNNGYHGMVRQWQELFYQHHYKAINVAGPNFVQVAEAFGIPGLRVTAQGQVREAIAEARAHRGPILLDCHVAPEENVYPMVPPGAALADTVEDPRVVHSREPVQALKEGTVSYP